MNPAIRIIFAPLGREERDYVWRGKSEAWNRTIYIDPRYGNAGRTLLHEFLHIKHPTWSETRVWAEERKQWKKMSWQEKAKIYRLLGKGRIKGESND